MAAASEGTAMTAASKLVECRAGVPPDRIGKADASLALARSLGIATAFAATDPIAAVAALAARGEPPAVMLFAGSLYLAGMVLAANDKLPD